MNDTDVLVISAATLGQIGLCFSLLLSRVVKTATYLPLAVLFLVIGVLAAAPVIFGLAPQLTAHYAACLLPASLLLGPMLWLYVVGLTSATKWRIEPRQAWHLLPFALGLIVAGLILALPEQARQAIFFSDTDINQGLALYAVIGMFSLILVWIIQSTIYVVRIFHRLSVCRRLLKDLFASNEQRELGWLSGLLITVGGVWFVATAALVASIFWQNSLFSHRVGAYLTLILVWSLAL